jgi:hypothetical protein
MPSPKTAKQRQQLLKQAFEFTEEALHTNQQGRLHTLQIAKLSVRRGHALNDVIVRTLPLLVMNIIPSIVVLSNNVPFVICLIPYLTTATVLIFLVWPDLQVAQNCQSDINHERIRSEVLTLRKRVEKKGLRSIHSANGFQLSEQEFYALEEGRRYRFYYTLYSQTVVAAEVIEDNPKP